MPSLTPPPPLSFLELDFLLEPLSFDSSTKVPQQTPAGPQLHPKQLKQRRKNFGNHARTQELLGGLVSAGPTLGSQLECNSSWQSQEWRNQLSTQHRQTRQPRRSNKLQLQARPFTTQHPAQQQQQGLQQHHHNILLPPPQLTQQQSPQQQELQAQPAIYGNSTLSCRQRQARRICHTCLPALAKLGLLVGKLARPLLPVANFLLAAGICAFAPGWPSIMLGAAAIASRGTLFSLQTLPPWRPAHMLLSPLRPLSQPMLVISVMWACMPACMPGLWRAVCYWNRLVPICLSYYRTSRRAKRLHAQGRHAEGDALWQAQHERGAHDMHHMLCDLKGFYMKLGQILATKTEMLPLPYTQSLSGLLDKLQAVPYAQVSRVLSRELHSNLMAEFAHIDTTPMATATIAQVHGGVLRGPDHRHVAIKVQHKGVQRMMRADLKNLKLAVDLLDLLSIDLGFDLGSIVREYYRYVPLECSFKREAEGMQAVKVALKARAASQIPLLRKVIIPHVYTHLSTDRVLVMSLVEGVPLLDASGMDAGVKSESMAALVMAYGVQILLEGIFHTDPHPGNLMALPEPAGGMRVAILDFGQMKLLTHNERVRYSLLVIAMASRDGDLLRATLLELGVRIENCEDSFVEIAGYILFDTRMDMPEALQSPMSSDSHEGWRTTRVPRLPQDLFMIMRVITLLRGVLASMQVHDVSSAIQWRPLAFQVLSDLTHVPRSLPASHEDSRNCNTPVSPRTPPFNSPSKALHSPARSHAAAASPALLFSSADDGDQGRKQAQSKQRQPDTPTILLAGRRFLAQQEVAVAHAQLSPRAVSAATRPLLSPTVPVLATVKRTAAAAAAAAAARTHSESPTKNTRLSIDVQPTINSPLNSKAHS